MSKNKSSNKTQKAHFATYKSEERHAKNKISKLERHVLKFPDDEQAQKAFSSLIENGVTYTRNRRALRPNATIQKVVRKVSQFSGTKHTFYAEIKPAVPEYALKKSS